jgi:hypothetical protein
MHQQWLIQKVRERTGMSVSGISGIETRYRYNPDVRSLPAVVPVVIPLQLLSGGVTPRESMPQVVQNLMLAAPTTHFTELG